MSDFLNSFFGRDIPKKKTTKSKTTNATSKDKLTNKNVGNKSTFKIDPKSLKKEEYIPPGGSVKYKDDYFLGIKKSKKPSFKYDAIFANAKTGKERRIGFGKKSEQDYTQHKNKDMKEFYDFKHKKEDWKDLKSTQALSKWILWNKISLESGLRDYKSKLRGIKR